MQRRRSAGRAPPADWGGPVAGSASSGMRTRAHAQRCRPIVRPPCGRIAAFASTSIGSKSSRL